MFVVVGYFTCSYLPGQVGIKSGLLQNVFGNQLWDSQYKTQYNLISVRSSQAACSHHEEACPKGTNSLLNCFGLYSLEEQNGGWL